MLVTENDFGNKLMLIKDCFQRDMINLGEDRVVGASHGGMVNSLIRSPILLGQLDVDLSRAAQRVLCDAHPGDQDVSKEGSTQAVTLQALGAHDPFAHACEVGQHSPHQQIQVAGAHWSAEVGGMDDNNVCAGAQYPNLIDEHIAAALDFNDQGPLPFGQGTVQACEANQLNHLAVAHINKDAVSKQGPLSTVQGQSVTWARRVLKGLKLPIGDYDDHVDTSMSIGDGTRFSREDDIRHHISQLKEDTSFSNMNALQVMDQYQEEANPNQDVISRIPCGR
ncbi:galactokinase [Sesbania bispinosa]|nr:galactokinase [Sesbania bispinosa]